MSGLARLFAEITEELSRPTEPPVSGISGLRQCQPENQVIENNDFSGISGVSVSETRPPQPMLGESTQARAHVRAGGRARVPHEKLPEMPETPEKLAGSISYFSGSLSLNPEKPEKREGSPLRGAPPGLSPDALAAYFERAGFLEYNCGLSRIEAETQALAELQPAHNTPPPLPTQDGLVLWRAGLARLHAGRVPCGGYRGDEWSRTLAHALAFLDEFGEQAAALGWTAPRLFGVHPTAGIVRVDTCGALVLPIGGAVAAITEMTIAFGHLTHRAKPGQPEGVPIWTLRP